MPDPDSDVADAKAVTDAGAALSAAESERIQTYIDAYFEGVEVVESRVDPSGTNFLCVREDTQPGLREFDERTGEIWFRELEAIPDDVRAEAARIRERSARGYEEGEVEAEDELLGCPAGTVPVKEMSYDAIATFGSLDAYLEHGWEQPTPDAHEYAKVDYSSDNYGGAAVFNIWNPFVAASDEFSLAQIWLVRGSGSDKQTVEAGWQDYPDRTGSSASKFFVFSTSDGYATGCYDDGCGDWVQVSPDLAPGFGWSNYSVTGGTQYIFDLEFYRGTSGTWWLIYKGDVLGYYPASLFDSAGLGPKAARASFGGEVAIDTTPDHSWTDMGNGYFPPSGFSYAAYIRTLEYRTSGGSWTTIPFASITEMRTDADCYEVDSSSSGGTWGTYFYFGGEGHGASCP